ncbi:sodium-independent sulfate anion transporter isoform X2 [Carettochelys insculpta]|uniref:sodium-independent sulfate anion transporter isoform X2 n=1 Tax=Carettochelys insculpta TaxID=44489 RepID=UPI003EC0A562
MAQRDPEAPGQCCSYNVVQRRLPVLRWLPQYSLQWLQLDLLAGVTVGLTVVPQALAYAEVAGLPVQYGLYSSFVGCFIYCLLGTSKDVTLGPTAIMSLLVSSYAFHDPAYAILLTFLSGCIQLAMGLLHLDFLLDFISCPVIRGFTSAASVTISFNQVKNILGLHNVPRQFFLQVYHTFQRIGETRAGDAVLGMLCLAVLMGLRAMQGHLPRSHWVEPMSVRISRGIIWAVATARNALVVLFASLVAYSFQVSGSQPFTLTGETPQGLPPFQPPPFSKAEGNSTVSFSEMVQDLGAGLAVVPLIGLLESIAIAKAFASRNNYRVDANQELLAMGLTNLLGSFVSSYPVTGSFGRTAVNAQTGVCTPAGGLITGTLVLLSLAYLTSLFYYIPKAALAAVIICAVAPVFDARVFRTLWQVKTFRAGGTCRAARERSAFPCCGVPPRCCAQTGSRSVAATLRRPGLHPPQQHGLHRGGGVGRPPAGVPEQGRHPDLLWLAGPRSPSLAGCKSGGIPTFPQPGGGEEEPWSRAASQCQRECAASIGAHPVRIGNLCPLPCH